MKKTIPCPECCGKGFISCCADNSKWATICNNCNGAGLLEVTMTNFDRIKAMSVEELAKLYVDFITQQKCVLGELERTSAEVIDMVRRKLFMQAVYWLESEVQEDEH